MKKQNYIYKLFSVFLMLVAVLFTACSGLFSNDIELADTATISISLDDSQNRTVKPVYDFSSFTDFQLTGTKSGGTEETLKTWSTYSALVSGSVTIETGSWSFTLQAKKGNETFRGSTTATISQGSSVQLGFVMEHIQYGNTGTLSVSLRYPVSKPDPENYFAEITRVEYQVREIGVTHTLITSGTLTGDALANHEINLSRINMNVGKYGFMCEFYKGNQDSDFVSSYYEIIEIESGLETVIDDDITYFMERGFASTAAETVNGKGQMKFVVNCPSGTTGVELVRYYGNDKETITGKWIGSESRNRVITFYDKYELVKDTEYSYFVRYNYNWSENYEYPVTLKATANGLTAPVVNSYPRFTFDGKTITSITPPNVTFYNNEVQNCDSVKLILEYRDADDTDNWDDFGKHIELLYDFQNNTYNFNEDYTLSLSGETRTLYGAKIIVEKDGLSREFRLRDWNTNNKAKNDGVPEDLIFAEITKNDYIHFPITIPSGTKSVRIERCMAPAGTGAVWEHVGGQNFDSPLTENRTETFYDYYAVNNSYYFYSVKFYDSSNTCSYYSFDETNPVAEGYSSFGYPCNFTGFSRPSFTTNPVITYTKNDDAGTFTITLTQAPTINWNGLGDNNTWWTIDYQYGNYFNWFNSDTSTWSKTGTFSDLSDGSNSLNLFYFYYSTGDFFNSYRYFSSSELGSGVPASINSSVDNTGSSSVDNTEPSMEQLYFAASVTNSGVEFIIKNIPAEASALKIFNTTKNYCVFQCPTMNLNGSCVFLDVYVPDGEEYTYKLTFLDQTQNEINNTDYIKLKTIKTAENSKGKLRLNCESTSAGIEISGWENWSVSSLMISRRQNGTEWSEFDNYTISINPSIDGTLPTSVIDYYAEPGVKYDYLPVVTLMGNNSGLYTPQTTYVTISGSVGSGSNFKILNQPNGTITTDEQGNYRRMRIDNPAVQVGWYNSFPENDTRWRGVHLIYDKNGDSDKKNITLMEITCRDDNPDSSLENWYMSEFYQGTWALTGYTLWDTGNTVSYKKTVILSDNDIIFDNWAYKTITINPFVSQ